MSSNNFGVWKFLLVLTPEDVAEQRQPTQKLVNMGQIILKDQEPVGIMRQTQFSKEPQMYTIPCPEGYERYLTNSPLAPVFFAKRPELAVNTWRREDQDAD